MTDKAEKLAALRLRQGLEAMNGDGSGYGSGFGDGKDGKVVIRDEDDKLWIPTEL